MTPTQLREALKELNGERDVLFAFCGVVPASGSPPHGSTLLEVRHAMLIPDESDHLVKVTDGKAVYILDAERVAWIRIGLK